MCTDVPGRAVYRKETSVKPLHFQSPEWNAVVNDEGPKKTRPRTPGYQSPDFSQARGPIVKVERQPDSHGDNAQQSDRRVPGINNKKEKESPDWYP